MATSNALPLMVMTENLSKDQNNASTFGFLSPDLMASHQDLHPIRIPDEPSNLVIPPSSSTLQLPVISSFRELQNFLQPSPPLNITEIKDATVVVPAVPNVQRANATEIDKLMVDLHIPKQSPNSSVIQHKADMETPVRGPRDLLPSIVANGNKELSMNPAGNPGIPPSAIEQQKGNLPNDLIVNPFGSSPALIPVGAAPVVAPPGGPVKPNPF
ncbi:hypothetical protein BV898_00187 [Hypsibius exemplaris]|uniref:Uncharacterized protein n=1 Tax=Hypsibius exemplaris TaxID=2072580 RepID=A0A1W0XF79_HYPEX|nr:hypothetical protein BV898_00187 [Hypsibius exemplaris]